MLTAKMNDKLNEQITFEFYSSYLYRQMASCLNRMGLTVFEKRYLQQADEEQAHALKLITYVQKAGGELRLGAIEAPKNDYTSVLEVVDRTLEHERGVTRRIHALVEQTELDKDYSTRSYLQWYIDEQVEEESSFAELAQLTRLAKDNYLVLEDRLEKMMAAQAAAAQAGAGA